MKWILFIFDDMLSDKAFKHHTSKLSTFSTLCRHYGISMIILTQKWNSIPNTIRIQSSATILLCTDNFTMSMIKENCKFGEEKWLLNQYQWINDAKEYGCIIINKTKPYDEWYVAIYPVSKKYERLNYNNDIFVKK